MDEEQVAHDQLFKDLLRAFFQEFMELFFPDVAPRLDFTRVVPRDKELFTDVPRGEQREADLVTEVQTRQGRPEAVLIHVEVEAGRRGMGARMHEYYMLLRLRLKLLVLPVVIYLTQGRGGLGTTLYYERVFGRRVVTFEFTRIGLPALPAEEYLASENPLAHGLAALMDPGVRRPSELKAECLLKVARALVDEARKGLLTNCVETYLELDEAEQQRFDELVQRPSYQEVREMRTDYASQIERRGKQEAALLQLREKFGELPEGVEARVRAMGTESELTTLLRQLLHARSLTELGLDDATA